MLIFTTLVSSQNYTENENIAFDSSKVFERGPDYNLYKINGKNVARVSPGPINYFNNDTYEPIDTTIIREDCEFDYCVREGVYWADFKTYSDSGDIVKFFYNDSYISYTPLDLSYVSEDNEEKIFDLKTVKGRAEDNEFTYSSAYGEGLDLEYEYHNSFLKENLIIKNADVLPKPNFENAYLSLSFLFNSESMDKNNLSKKHEVFFSGTKMEESGFVGKLFGEEFKEIEKENLKWDENSEIRIKGEVRFNKEDDSFGFRLPTLYAVDDAGNFIELEYVFNKKGNDMIVSILTPYKWLSDKERVYPVKIDPSVSGKEHDVVRMTWHFDGGGYDDTTNPYLYVAAGTNGALTKYRSYFSWDFSSSLRNELSEADVDDAYVAFGVDSDDGSYPVLYVDDDSDYTASRDAEDWFDYIDGGSSASAYSTGSSNAFSVSDYQVEGMSNSAKDFFVHLTGYEGGAQGIVYIDEEAWLNFDYDCNIDSSCNEYCLLDNGDDCDCSTECIGGWCSGSSYGNYDCNDDGCVADGYYTTEADACCSGLSWNSGTEECYEAVAVCGNGDIEGDETCDDGDTSSGDGCSSTCVIESGWACSGEPSSCSLLCGNGNIDSGESCDGINLNSQSCYTQGFDSGTLACTSSCTFDTSLCINTEECSGEINVFVADSSGSAIGGAYAYLDGSGTGYATDSDDGFYKFDTNGDCGDSYSVQIKCEDQGTVCGSDSTRITYPDDVDSMYFICDVCSEEKDILIDESSIRFSKSGSDVNLSFIVKSVGITDDFSAELTCGELGKEDISISAGESKLVSFVGDLGNCRKVDIVLSGISSEDGDNSNNRVDDVFVIDVLKVELNVNTGNGYVDNAIEEFLGDYVEVVSSGADAEVYVGNGYAPDYNGVWGVKSNLVKYNGETEGVPYVGMVVKEDGEIYVFGNDVDGIIAATRRLVDEREEYLNERTLDDDMEVYLGETDVGAISVYDYLHTDENDEFYRKDNSEFGEIVSNVLRKQTFNLAIKRVLTANDNTSLRLKNVNQELSPTFKDFIDNTPVVLGHGLFGNLFSMEELGLKIAMDEVNNENYRDTWLIEYSGGPNTECENCPNYDMDDLVDSYWPALIGGVLAYTGKDKVDYVGYSAGGGVGARSYEEYSSGTIGTMGYYLNDNGNWESFDLPEDFVDHMALIAPMGAFNGESLLVNVINYSDGGCGEYSLDLLSSKEHFTNDDIKKALLLSIEDGECDSEMVEEFIINKLGGGENVSYNFWSDVIHLITDSTDLNPVLNISELAVISGDVIFFNGDGIIPEEDIDYIYENSIANKKELIETVNFHLDMPNRPEIQDRTIKFLNDRAHIIYM